MNSTTRIESPARFSFIVLVLVAILVVLGLASCKSPHRPTRRTEVRLDSGWPRGEVAFQQASYRKLQVTVPEIPGAEFVEDDELCETCHEAYVRAFEENNVHRGDSCESCHGPASRHLETRGEEPGLILSFKSMNPCERSEVCLKCHEDDRCSVGARWRTSVHAHQGVACTDCHTSHYNVPEGTPVTTGPDAAASRRQAQPVGVVRGQDPVYETSLSGSSNNLGAVAPYVCYRCHCDMRQYQEIAGPHQICGPNGFNCTTCHDAHGKIHERTRKELCLQCHGQGAPVMAWHSSTHNLQGVACTDCHNPHPNTHVQQLVNITYTHVRRPKRIQMAVEEPEVCYGCHPQIYGLNALPSHHPIKEGKMVCSDCHDGHGQTEGNLKEPTLNLVCYRCHAEKQGPFVWEHPPVTENCAICHEPHGTVANNLLRQPTTFLCLRCHRGHRGFRRNLDETPAIQAQLYTNCSQCHSQVHGSDHISQTLTGPRLTR